MPKIDITFEDHKEKYTIHAEGWFIGSITFNNNPRSTIKKMIKEYGFKDE